MNKDEDLKNKLLKWVNEIEKSSEKDVSKCVDNFEEIFKGQFEEEYESDTEDEYYEFYSRRIILANEIEIEIVSGDWDRFGSLTSHYGKDLHLWYKRDPIKEEKEALITIFSFSEFIPESINEIRNLINSKL